MKNIILFLLISGFTAQVKAQNPIHDGQAVPGTPTYNDPGWRSENGAMRLGQLFPAPVTTPAAATMANFTPMFMFDLDPSTANLDRSMFQVEQGNILQITGLNNSTPTTFDDNTTLTHLAGDLWNSTGYRLDLKPDNRYFYGFHSNWDGNSTFIGEYKSGSSAQSIIGYSSDINPKLHFASMENTNNNASIKMTLDQNGYLGINRQSPETYLDVRMPGGTVLNPGNYSYLAANFENNATSLSDALIGIALTNYGGQARFSLGSGGVFIGSDNAQNGNLGSLNLTYGNGITGARIRHDGVFKIFDLAGTGTRMVVANANGELSTQVISGDNLGDHNATQDIELNGNAIIFSGTKELSWNGSEITSSDDFKIDGDLKMASNKIKFGGTNNHIWYDGSNLKTGSKFMIGDDLKVDGNVIEFTNLSSNKLEFGTGKSISFNGFDKINITAGDVEVDNDFTVLGESFFSQDAIFNLDLDVNGDIVAHADIEPSSNGGGNCGNSGKMFAEVWVNGAVLNGSDRRLKENIVPLNYGLNDLLKIESVSYNFKGKNKNDIGFIAQDFRNVIPELVVEGNDEQKILGVNYAGLVPVLVNAIKEQNANITKLEDEIANLKTEILTARPKEDSRNTFNNDELLKSRLFQNTPNPFAETTNIQYEIQGEYSHAFIGIYSLSGAQLKLIQLNENVGNISVNKSELNGSGQYVYSLIVNGELIDSKKMVLF